jgi:hypothetical protein
VTLRTFLDLHDGKSHEHEMVV